MPVVEGREIMMIQARNLKDLVNLLLEFELDVLKEHLEDIKLCLEDVGVSESKIEDRSFFQLQHY